MSLVAVLLACGVLAVALGRVAAGRPGAPRIYVVAAALLLPASVAADVAHFVLEPADPAGILVTETLTLAIVVVTASAYREWVTLLCGAWLVAGCLTITGVGLTTTLAGVTLTSAHDTEILGTSLALFVALGVCLGVNPIFRETKERVLSSAFVWLRALGWIICATGALVGSRGLQAAGGWFVAAAYVVVALLIVSHARRPGYVEEIPPPVIPTRLAVVVTGIGVATAAVAAIVAPSFLRWSVVVLVAGSAGSLLTWQVLTMRRLTQEQRATAVRERYYRSLVQDSTDVVALCDESGVLHYTSPAAMTVLRGYTRAGVLTAAQLVGASDDDFAAALAECARTGRARIDGRRGEQSLEAVLARREDEVVLSVRDVTERDTMRADLHELAYTDTLTGLPNRNRVVQEVGRVLEQAPDTTDLFVLFVDLDRFKHVNDASGHHVGDAVLEQAAARLRECLEEDALLGRIGGDEFVVVGRGAPRLASRIAATINRRLGVPFTVDGHVYQLGASVGIAMSEPGADADALLQRADLAMYEAKQAHRPWCLYEPSMSAQARRVADRDHGIAQEWGRSAVEVYLQPIVSTRTFEVYSTEALLRWRRADGTIESPAAALDFAERNGRLPELTGWIVEKVLAEVSATPETTTPIAVNLPPTVLREPGFATSLAARVAQLGIPPARLHLEITEEDMVVQGKSGHQALVGLHDEGFHLHIDDFGTGFSSLSYLVTLPVDGLKIDRSFVQEVCTSTAARSVIMGLVSLAQEVGIDLIAEGVETLEQHEALKRLGVAYAQGFWYGCPEASSEVVDRSSLSGWTTGLRTPRSGLPTASGIIGA